MRNDQLQTSQIVEAMVRLTDALDKLTNKLPVVEGLLEENQTIASRKQELADRQLLANRQRALRTAKKSSKKKVLT